MKELFYKTLTIKGDEENIFFWSDLHYGHECKNWSEPLWKKRGFQNLQDHDEVLVERWNKTLLSDSIIFMLGDIMFGENGGKRLPELLNKLNFKTMYLMPGNHHAGWRQVFEGMEGHIFYPIDGSDTKRVIFCPNYLEVFINGQAVVMSHYALISWNGQGGGSYMIHGHSHSTLYGTEMGNLLYKARIIDVGVENCPYPISFGQVKQKFAVEAVSFDHHNKNTQNPF